MYSIEPTDYICKCGGKIYYYIPDNILDDCFHRCVKCNKVYDIEGLTGVYL